jgi:hypothetical protein
MSRFFKSKNKQKAPQPREMKEITAEYNTTASQAGTVQYQIKVYQSQLEQLNQKMLNLNNEGAERQRLDAQTKKEEKEAK